MTNTAFALWNSSWAGLSPTVRTLGQISKRSFDIIAASSALLLASPLFLFLAYRVRRDGGPAYFAQERIGRGGARFRCYKFRSMSADAEDALTRYLAENAQAAEEWATYQKLKNDVRITAIGRFLRRTSLDELPQFWNVLKGDMSMVGPRPILPGQEHYYGARLILYESVRPGLTGPWQVGGRNALSFYERVRLESGYVYHRSFWLDLKIIAKTLPAMLSKGQAF